MKGKGGLVLLLLAGVVGIYVYIKGGSLGGKSTGGNSVDAHDVVNGVGNGAGAVKDAVAPWWSEFYSQPWFWSAVVGLGITWLLIKTWSKMPGFVRAVFLVALTVAVVVIVLRFH
jgi:hypothetical protein